jgi:type II secretory pathway component PulF
LPIIGRFFSPVDNATVMQTLSVAVQEDRPINEILEILAAQASLSRPRARLNAAVGQIRDGAHWCDALQRTGLVTRAQGAVFRSAERAGNLAWALAEMADTAVRRAARRAQATLSVLFPTMILGFGLCVLLIAVGMLAPLFSLISNLS